ncbi:MAG TPA: hypothetical protein VGM88_33680 [Kofleriaceae bacterium]|jgi:hypothetical protein
MLRSGVRFGLLVLLAASPVAADPLPAHQTFADLPSALAATIPSNARVVGFGELHARTDRAPVRSSLSQFTAALPAFGAKVSDLIVETWIVDPKCGKQAAATTAKVESDVRRPVSTKSEIELLAEAARAAKIQPHAMTLSCADYDALGKGDATTMLTITTRELARISASAVSHRDAEPGHRPWIAVYGGALHNDRFPDASVAEWSYAAAADKATGGHFVEVDLVVPSLAEADATSRAQPWFPLVGAADASHVLVWKRGDRSFVVILPREAK